MDYRVSSYNFNHFKGYVNTELDESTLWTFFLNENKGKLSEIELEDLQPAGRYN